jgi:hypothetical protein
MTIENSASCKRFVKSAGPVVTKIQKSGFCDYFKERNHLDELEFKAWLLLPGMRFDSSDKWWGDFEKRKTRHEGVDFCLYKDQQDHIFSVEPGMKVPAMYDGLVVAVIDDFLGRSVVVKHDFSGGSGEDFCTLYAHTVPLSGLTVGMTIHRGDVLAMVADKTASRLKISPHIHISAGFPENGVSYNQLNWKDISLRKQLQLIDPMLLL